VLCKAVPRLLQNAQSQMVPFNFCRPYENQTRQQWPCLFDRQRTHLPSLPQSGVSVHLQKWQASARHRRCGAHFPFFLGRIEDGKMDRAIDVQTRSCRPRYETHDACSDQFGPTENPTEPSCAK
jgi:hypothetical protein